MEKKSRSTADLIAALKLDALNPLSQEAGQRLEDMARAMATQHIRNLSLAQTFWAVLRQHGKLAVSSYWLRRSPMEPAFRMAKNQHNDDMEIEALAKGEKPEGENDPKEAT